MRLAIPITVALTASLLVALVFVPLSVYLTLPSNGGNGGGWYRRTHDRANGVMRTFYEATMGRLNRMYGVFLGFFLRRRLDLTLAMLVVFILTGSIAFKEVQLTEAQENEEGGFEIDVEFPRDTTLEEAADWFAEAEKVVQKHKEEWGIEGYFVFHHSRWGELEGWFTNPRTSEVTGREVTKLLKDLLPEKPGIKLYTGQRSDTEEEKNKPRHHIVLHGDDWRTLETTADELEEFLVQLPGVLGALGSQERPLRGVGVARQP